MTTNDTHAAALTAAEVADLANRLRYILDITPAQASFVRPIHRRMAVQLYRCLCAYSALLMPKEE